MCHVCDWVNELKEWYLTFNVAVEEGTNTPFGSADVLVQEYSWNSTGVEEVVSFEGSIDDWDWATEWGVLSIGNIVSLEVDLLGDISCEETHSFSHEDGRDISGSNSNEQELS